MPAAANSLRSVYSGEADGRNGHEARQQAAACLDVCQFAFDAHAISRRVVRGFWSEL